MTPHIDRVPGGYLATDDDIHDGAPDSEWPSNCIGYGLTRQDALDDLCDQMEVPRRALEAA